MNDNIDMQELYNLCEKVEKYHKALSEIASCSEQGNPIYLRKIAKGALENE
tara:strand:- start:150 stop:302 length:153 start_codon:yes stop_codon:yes gene_type:complete